jgi:hypothetical protein
VWENLPAHFCGRFKTDGQVVVRSQRSAFEECGVFKVRVRECPSPACRDITGCRGRILTDRVRRARDSVASANAARHASAPTSPVLDFGLSG